MYSIYNCVQFITTIYLKSQRPKVFEKAKTSKICNLKIKIYNI